MRLLLSVLSLCCLCCLPARANGLPDAVAEALRAAGIPAASVAAVAQPLEAAAPRLAHNADAAMNPASSIKLLTTYAALDLLGPAYTWTTEAFLDGPVVEGVLAGDLVLRGNGDPKLTYERFWRLLRDLRMGGLREIRGDLVLDRGAFAVAAEDPGAFDGQPLRPYNVTPDALLIGFKSVTLRLSHRDGEVRVWAEPAPANLDIVNRLRPAGRDCGDWREKLRADLFEHGAADGGARLVLTGDYAPACGEQRWNLAVLDHSRYVLGLFRQLWGELGGVFAGGVREGPAPPGATPAAVLPSLTLAEAVRDINKFSNNVMARQVYLSLALAAGRRPARVEDAEAVLRDWLAARGLTLPGLVLENGSGLSRSARLSAAGLVGILRSAWHSAVMPELMASLPVAATDGTLRRRLKGNGVAGQAHVKTGTLEGVRSLAGYVLDRHGRRWAVAFMVNHPRAAASQGAQDALLQWVYDGGGL